MSLSTDEILRLMDRAKELGLKQFEVEGLKFSFDEGKVGQNPPTIPVDISEVYKELPVLDQLTEDEILYWSTPYFGELQAIKEAKLNNIEEEKLTKEG